METRIGPIRYSPNQAVLEGVYIHIIHMTPEVGFVTDEMFPITSLPDSTLASLQAHG